MYLYARCWQSADSVTEVYLHYLYLRLLANWQFLLHDMSFPMHTYYINRKHQTCKVHCQCPVCAEHTSSNVECGRITISDEYVSTRTYCVPAGTCGWSMLLLTIIINLRSLSIWIARHTFIRFINRTLQLQLLLHYIYRAFRTKFLKSYNKM